MRPWLNVTLQASCALLPSLTFLPSLPVTLLPAHTLGIVSSLRFCYIGLPSQRDASMRSAGAVPWAAATSRHPAVVVASGPAVTRRVGDALPRGPSLPCLPASAAWPTAAHVELSLRRQEGTGEATAAGQRQQPWGEAWAALSQQPGAGGHQARHTPLQFVHGMPPMASWSSHDCYRLLGRLLLLRLRSGGRGLVMHHRPLPHVPHRRQRGLIGGGIALRSSLRCSSRRGGRRLRRRAGRRQGGTRATFAALPLPAPGKPAQAPTRCSRTAHSTAAGPAKRGAGRRARAAGVTPQAHQAAAGAARAGPSAQSSTSCCPSSPSCCC